MPFRARVKSMFGRSPKAPDDPNDPNKKKELSKVKSEKSEKSKKKKKGDKWEDWPENIYKPHEMPRMKYRRVPEESHKKKLESYNWESNTPPEAEEDRRNSHSSLYSPMGSRLPSRMGSIVSKLGPSRGPSRTPSMVAENEADESDLGNVGLSRVHTHDSKSRRRSSRAFSYSSRPGSANPPPLAERSEENSKADTPDGTLVDPADAYADADADAGADGAELDTAKTITEASEREKGRRERADTLKLDRPFTGEELDRALTGLTVRREGAAGARS